MWNAAVSILLVSNGIYDIACAASIVWAKDKTNLFARLHLSMFRDGDEKSSPLFQRMLAYWILTYGLMRIAAALMPLPCMLGLGIVSYCVEAGCFLHELSLDNSVQGRPTYFVTATCLLLCILFSILYAQGVGLGLLHYLY
jgi:Erg28 like protein